MRATLFKRESTHQNLRTNEVAGDYVFEPTVGEHFVIIGESLDPTKDLRMVRTSPVTAVEKDGATINFTTQNSKYTLTIWGEST